MYYISNKNVELKMMRSSQSMTTFIKSIVLEEDEFENKNIYKEAKIYENVRVNERYNNIKNHEFSITQIKFTFEDKTIILVINPNDTRDYAYKDIQNNAKKKHKY